MTINPLLPIWAITIIAVLLLSLIITRIITERSSRRSRWLRRLAMSLIVITICLRPILPFGQTSSVTTNISIIFVVDVTGSMIAEDYDGTKPRLDGVRADIKSIASSFAGARFSVIAFDNSPFTPLPFTSDASALFTTVDILYPIDTFNSTGSNITSSLQDAEAAARRVLDSHPDRKVVLFYLGDGEQTSDQDISIPSSLSELLSGGAVLGYGTEAGGRMQEVWLHSTANDIRYIQDRSSQWPWPDALSKIDEDNLRAIAESLEIPYFHRTEPNSTKEITDQVEQSARRFSGSGTQASTDIYWILCLILIALLFWELNGVVVRLSSSKRSRS